MKYLILILLLTIGCQTSHIKPIEAKITQIGEYIDNNYMFNTNNFILVQKYSKNGIIENNELWAKEFEVSPGNYYWIKREDYRTDALRGSLLPFFVKTKWIIE